MLELGWVVGRRLSSHTNLEGSGLITLATGEGTCCGDKGVRSGAVVMASAVMLRVLTTGWQQRENMPLKTPTYRALVAKVGSLGPAASGATAAIHITQAAALHWHTAQRATDLALVGRQGLEIPATTARALGCVESGLYRHRGLEWLSWVVMVGVRVQGGCHQDE